MKRRGRKRRIEISCPLTVGRGQEEGIGRRRRRKR